MHTPGVPAACSPLFFCCLYGFQPRASGFIWKSGEVIRKTTALCLLQIWKEATAVMLSVAENKQPFLMISFGLFIPSLGQGQDRTLVYILTQLSSLKQTDIRLNEGGCGGGQLGFSLRGLNTGQEGPTSPWSNNWGPSIPGNAKD